MKKLIFSNILELKIEIRFILVWELLLSYAICYALYEINVSKFSMVLRERFAIEYRDLLILVTLFCIANNVLLSPFRFYFKNSRCIIS